jgi:hypothetical protein
MRAWQGGLPKYDRNLVCPFSMDMGTAPWTGIFGTGIHLGLSTVSDWVSLVLVHVTLSPQEISQTSGQPPPSSSAKKDRRKAAVQATSGSPAAPGRSQTPGGHRQT